MEKMKKILFLLLISGSAYGQKIASTVWVHSDTAVRRSGMLLMDSTGTVGMGIYPSNTKVKFKEEIYIYGDTMTAIRQLVQRYFDLQKLYYKQD